MLIDNKLLKLGDVLRKQIGKNDDFSMISSYVTLYGYEALRKELDRIKTIRFLFPSPYTTSSKIESLSGIDREIPLRNQLNQKDIAKRFAEWIESKAEFREVVNSLDAPVNPLFHISNGEKNVAITGNADFTVAGLGYSHSTNMYMNFLVEDNKTAQQVLDGFHSVWNDKTRVRDCKQTILAELKRISEEKPPEHIYYFTLYQLFRSFIGELEEDTSEKENIGFYQSIIWNKLYKFQQDGVKGVIDKLEKHNGCILADSVGLGKTFEALAVIKYYELKKCRVLVIAPKKLRENWTTYLGNNLRNILVDDDFHYTVLNHTDLTRTKGNLGDIPLKTFNWSNYDLVVIDESHNFRNSGSKDRLTRYSRLMDDIIRNGIPTKVLMLSATPVNNRLNDLKNQIAFATHGEPTVFAKHGIANYETILTKAQKQFNNWMKQDPDTRTTKDLTDTLGTDYFKLLDLMTIARSRKHITKYYHDSLDEIGDFPERLPAVRKRVAIDTQGDFPAILEIDRIIRKLELAPYSPLKYVRPDKIDIYKERYDRKLKNGRATFAQRDREDSLIHLMRVNLLKRMESSIHSFHATLDALLIKVNDLLAAIEGHEIQPEETIDFEDIDLESGDFDNLLIGSNKVKVLLQDCDLVKWKQDLTADKEKLVDLLKKSRVVDAYNDKKLIELKKLIADKIEHPINEKNKKVIIFTAFENTAEYLYENIAEWAKEKFDVHSARVTGGKPNQTTLDLRDKSLDSILTNFSPISKDRQKFDESPIGEIDILIATDCISEGQNLQDCDMLINYDIHWNPVRIIQRFGRIDRLGSKNKKIQLVNFWPDIELDEYINLEARVSGRMKLLNISATGEEDVLEIDPNSEESMNDLKYRKKQLEKLQSDVFDLEEISGGISITDLTLNDFRLDLANYVQNHKEDLEKGIKGSFSVVEKDHLDVNLESGALFCLRYISKDATLEKENPIFPYYLLYITENGKVGFGVSDIRKILDLFRSLCQGKSDAVAEAIEFFNEKTNFEKNMSLYTGMLQCAIREVLGIEENRLTDSLFDSQRDDLGAKTTGSTDSFECISWLAVV